MGNPIRLLAFAVVSFLAIAPPVKADTSLIFGLYASDSPSTLVRQFRPLLNEIETRVSARLGETVKISMHVASTYDKGIEELATGHVDFSRLGPASYVMAKQKNPDISILAMEKYKGGKVFNGIICVAADSSISIVSDLKGRSFAFGDKNSTIGRYLSQDYLLKQGITSSTLSNFSYLGRHDKVGGAVAIGQFDGGAIKESTFKKLVAKGEPLRSIAVFPNVTKPWVARAGLPQKIRDTLQEVLLSLERTPGLKQLKKEGFLPGSDSDFSIVRQTMADNPKFFR